MVSSEKFCLKWNDFESNISTAFQELRDDKDFFDVTLACEDDQVEAHKVILSACSPFFRSVLKKNKHQHPLLYLKGVRFADLLSVLNFMYQGEVNVAQNDLNTFLAIAEDLKVKGLTQHETSNKKSAEPAGNHGTQSQSTTASLKNSYHSDHLPKSVMKHDVGHQSDDDIQEVLPVKTEPITPSIPQPHPYAPTPVNSVNTINYTQEPVSHSLAVSDDYPDYEGYDDTGVDYDGTLMHSGVDDANKGNTY